jgi:hypothetical protein
MDREIFHLEISTEATSLYILICSLLDEGVTPTLNRIRSRWNGSEAELSRAIDDLIHNRVLEGPTSAINEAFFKLNPKDLWRQN